MSERTQSAWALSDSELRPGLALALAIEHAPMGVLLLRNEKSGALEPVVAEGFTDEQRLRFGTQRPGVKAFGTAFDEHRHVNISDVDGDGDIGLQELAKMMGFRCVDVVPLTLGDGNAIGVLAAFFPRARRPSARSAHMAELCGQVLGLAFENARLRADADRRRAIAEGLARARVQFVARVSHELRTPLQSIIGYIDLLRLGRPDPLTERQAHMLERVREGERVLLKVIDDLLSMGRLEAGRLEYNVRAVMLNDVMHAAAAIVEPLATQKDVRLEVPETSLIVAADATKTKQILINLMANAVKFTPCGGSITLKARREGRNIAIDVCDSGPGIPAEKLGQVFEPYVQASPAIDELAGTGLGLAISREFAYRMGGTLTVSSSVGHGSVFTLRLPRAGSPRSGLNVSPSPNVEIPHPTEQLQQPFPPES